MGYRSFTLRLEPSPRQCSVLDDLFRFQREVYNAALEERIGAWKQNGRSVNKRDQYRELTGWDDPRLKRFGVVVTRGSLLRLDRAFKAFFRRVQNGESPGFPRFKGENRFTSVEWEDGNGWKVVDRTHLRVMGVGHIKVVCRKGQRGIKGTPKTMVVRRRGDRFEAVVVCELDTSTEREPTGREVGVDVGVASFATLSNGEQVENPRWYRNAEAKLSAKQRKRERHKRGSRRHRELNRQIAKAHEHVANQRKDFHHKLSKDLVARFDLIAVEDLKIANMSRRPKPRPSENEDEWLPNGATSKGGLNKSIQDAGWGLFLDMVRYKAVDAGVELVKVNPRHTSQTCYECRHVAAGNRVSQAEFCCLACGHTAHADVNAARNILRLGQSQREVQREAPSKAAA